MEKNPKKKRINSKYQRRVIFNSRTFNSKLFLKLTGHFIHPSIVCVQTLKYEKDNRKIGEIEKALPWLKKFPDLMNFINLKETPESSHKLLIELTWLLFYRYYKKNIIFKKAAEKGDFFFIVLGGKMLKLDMVFHQERLTVEEYLIYLFKMKLSKEKEILKRCRILNSFYADIDGENLAKFCKENPQFNYDKLKEIAKKEIYELGFKLEDFQDNKKNKYIFSIDNFIKIAEVKKNTKYLNNILATPKFYVGSYEKVGYITKGMILGNLTNELFIDDSTYITVDNCDILFLNKRNSNLKKLYEMIIEKKQRILSEIKNSFFIFRNITETGYLKEVIPYFEYKLYHKGDKIFAQGSLHEGIYLIKSGKINLYFNSSMIEITSYISKIKNSLRNFKKFISSLKIFKQYNMTESEFIKSSIDQSPIPTEKKALYTSKQYEILTIPELSIFGTNELYDYETNLYYFSAECMTKEAVIYYLPKKYYIDLLKKEYPVYVAVAETVEIKAKFIIEKMKLIIKQYELNRIKSKIRNHSETKDENNFMKTFTIFNNYRNSIKSLRRNNNLIGNHYPELKLFTKMEEKTYEFPAIVKEKYLANKNILTETIKENNKNYYHSIREKIMNNFYKNKVMKTINNVNINTHIKNNINRRNKTFEKKILTNKNGFTFKKDIKLELPSNFPFNVKDEFPTIVKNKIKNYNFKYIITEAE